MFVGFGKVALNFAKVALIWVKSIKIEIRKIKDSYSYKIRLAEIIWLR